jgi:catechol 2,3-dioxygenase-like lactoylglutathione lyase family enzyme
LRRTLALSSRNATASGPGFLLYERWHAVTNHRQRRRVQDQERQPHWIHGHLVGGCADLWIDVLGFRHLYTWNFETSPFVEQVTGVPGSAARLAMLEGHGYMIELLEYTAPDNRQTYKPRSCDVGSVHVAFYVDNLDALLARAASFGWLPVGSVQTMESGEREGLRLVYVRSPDGITIEFLELPEYAPDRAA